MSERKDNFKEVSDFYTGLELELNGIIHQGAPLGAMLSRFFIISYRTSFVQFKRNNAFQDLYVICKAILLPILTGKERKQIYKIIEEKKPKYIIAKIDNGQVRGNKLFRDLLSRCSPHVLSTTTKNNIDRSISIPIMQYRWLSLPLKKSFSVLYSCIIHSSTVFRKMKRAKMVDVSYFEILSALFYTTLQFIGWENLFNKYKPAIVLTDFDRLNPELILAAKKKNIPTVTLVHGTIDKRYGYYPLLADKVFCWGKEQKDFFIEKGIEEKRIKINGNPIAESFGVLPQEEILSKYKIDNGSWNHFVGLALSIMSEKQGIALVKEILDTIDSKSFLIVKLHPSDKQADIFSEEFKEYKNILFSQSISFQEFISVIGCCILQNSGIGNELIVCGVPVLFFNNDGSVQYSSYYPFFKDYFYNNSAEIKDELNMLLNSAEHYQDTQKKQHDILKENIFYKVGQEAADENIVQLKSVA